MRDRGAKGRFPLLSVLGPLLLLGTILSGCATPMLGKRSFAPDPQGISSGRMEVREGFLVASSEGIKVSVKFLTSAEWLDFMRGRSKDPIPFDPTAPWIELMTPFLVTITNGSPVPLIFEGQKGTLRDDRDHQLSSMGLLDFFPFFSEEAGASKEMEMMARVLFRSAPMAVGESREGLLFFRPPEPKAKGANLEIILISADRALKRHQFSFPFVIESLQPESRGASPQGLDLGRKD